MAREVAKPGQRRKSTEDEEESLSFAGSSDSEVEADTFIHQESVSREAELYDTSSGNKVKHKGKRLNLDWDSWLMLGKVVSHMVLVVLIHFMLGLYLPF